MTALRFGISKRLSPSDTKPPWHLAHLADKGKTMCGLSYSPAAEKTRVSLAGRKKGKYCGNCLKVRGLRPKDAAAESEGM